MLEHKGIDYRRVNFPPGPHRVLVRLIGFPGDRVPAVKFDDGRRRSGHARAAARTRRAGARAAPGARGPACARGRALGRRRAPAVGSAHGGLHRLTQSRRARRSRRRRQARALLTPYERPRRTVVARWCWWPSGVTKEQLRDDRERTGEILDQVDAWIAEGVLNGEQLRSPDLRGRLEPRAGRIHSGATARAAAPAPDGADRAGVQPQGRSTRSSVSLRPSSVSASTRRRNGPRLWIRLRGTLPLSNVGRPRGCEPWEC